MNDSLDRISGAISQQRLWQRHMDLGAIGATPRGGVNRLALSAEDAQAQQLFFNGRLPAATNAAATRSGTCLFADKDCSPTLPR